MTKNIIKFIFIFCIGLSGAYLTQSHKDFCQFTSETALTNLKPIATNAVNVINCTDNDEHVGEYYLGKDIEKAMQINFPNTIMYNRNNMYQLGRNPQIYLYLRGYYKFSPPFPNNEHLNLAYVIYPLFYTHPNEKYRLNRDRIIPEKLSYGNIAFDELQFYDALLVASKPYYKKLLAAGYNAYYVPQFTNTEKFYRDYYESLKSDVLFVGTKRTYGAADIALKYNLPITIYGPRWGKIAKADYIKNEELHKYYSSAKIVLNDHRQDMRIHGFINNRVYDVTAVGTLLISDYIPEIQEIYGDTIPMYKDETELVTLIRYYLSHPEERERKARAAQAITLKYFSHKKIAATLNQIIRQELQKKQVR